MRNLKRALSLALALVMVLSMMVVGASAVSADDFSDSADIVNKEAVTVLATLGVITGNDDGSYAPTDTISRAEMSTIICRVLNGGKDPVLGEAVSNSYTDTASHWAKNYIEYCTTLGIVAGKGDGTFDPEGDVTVAEAAKMVLVALGYNAGVEGYTGGNWQINTDARANPLGLYDALDYTTTSAALTRDNAAQMLYNALDCKMVTYDYIITGNVQDAITTKPQLNDRDLGTLLWEKFRAVKLEGVVVANEYAVLDSTRKDTDKAPTGTVIGSHLDAGKTTIAVTNYDPDSEQHIFGNSNFDEEYTFNVSSGENELAKGVYVYVKPYNETSDNANRATVIGSVNISEDNTIVTDASGDSVADVADDNGLDLIEGETQYAYNYAQIATLGLDRDNEWVLPSYDGKVGIEKTLIDTDADGDVNYVLYKEMGLGRVTAHSASGDGQIVVDVPNGNYISKDSAAVVGFDDVERNNYVLTAYIGGRLYVQVAETVTGTIDAYKQTDTDPQPGDTYRNTGFTVDGEPYNVSRVFSTENNVTPAVDEVDKSILDSDATFYLDLNGNVIAYGEVDESAYKYAYVWGTALGDTNVDSDRVKVTLEDGTTKTYELDDDSQVDLSTAITGGLAGKAFPYSITSSGTIRLSRPAGGAVEEDLPTFTKGLTNIRFKGGDNEGDAISGMAPTGVTPEKTDTYYSNNGTTFFYVETRTEGTTKIIESVDVYNGRNEAPSVDGTAGNAVLALNRNGIVASAVFEDVAVTESAGDHLFLFNAGYVWTDFGKANVFFNGEEGDQEVDVAYVEDLTNHEIVHNPDVGDGIYLYRYNNDGYYEITSPAGESFYEEGRAYHELNSQNTFVIRDPDTGAFKMECVLTENSLVIDYDHDNDAPIATLGGSVPEDAIVKVIVNNEDDGEVLMAVIWDRPDYTNEGDEGPDFGVDGAEMGRNTTLADVNAALKDGNVVITGNWTPNDAPGTLTIPANRTLKIEGTFDAHNQGIVINADSTTTSKLVVEGTFDVSEDIYYPVTAQDMVIRTLTGVDAKTVTISADVDVADILNARGSGEIVVAAGTTLTVGTDVVNKDENGNDLSDTVSFQIKGTMTVDGNMVTDATVFSDESLHVTGTMSGDLTIGDAKNVGYAEIGTITGDVVVANGTLYVTEELDTNSVKASKEGTIEFANDATVGTKAEALFTDLNGEPVSDVGGMTFTGSVDVEDLEEAESGVSTGEALSLDILVNAKNYEGYTEGTWKDRYQPDNFTIDGNTVTISTSETKTGNAERSSNMEWVARFLGALHEANEGVTEIVYGDTTFKWNADAKLNGSKWTVNGEEYNNGEDNINSRNSLIYYIYGSTTEGSEIKPVDPSSITLTVDGTEIVINVEYGY